MTIGDDYFETLGVRLLAGRPLGPLDGEPGRQSAIVNQRFVDVHFPDENPLGQRLRLSNPRAPADHPPPWITIVGVSASVRQRSHDYEAEPVVYFPFRGDPGAGAVAIVRPRADAGPVVSRIREEIAQLDRDLPLFRPMPLEEAMAVSRTRQRVLMTVLGLFAGLALILASVGVYGLTAHAVAQQTREVGIRMALGAPRARVVWGFMRRSMAPVAVGLALGAAGAVIAGRVLSGLLVRTSATDPITFLVCAAFVALVALSACLVSARHATSTDPVSVLRST